MKSDQAINAIKYNAQFRENVEGQLKAQFRVDRDGTPSYELHPEDRRLRVYTIDVFLVTPRSKEINGVTYYMDDESYVDPWAYSDDANNEFREEITSYGDVEILVTVELRNHNKYEQRAWLSNLLENGYGDGVVPPAIREAIERIKVN